MNNAGAAENRLIWPVSGCRPRRVAGSTITHAFDPPGGTRTRMSERGWVVRVSASTRPQLSRSRRSPFRDAMGA